MATDPAPLLACSISPPPSSSQSQWPLLFQGGKLGGVALTDVDPSALGLAAAAHIVFFVILNFALIGFHHTQLKYLSLWVYFRLS